MKRRFINWTMAALCWAVWATVLPGRTQSPAGLEIQLHLALAVTGSVGAVYLIESRTAISPSNGWHSVGLVQLAVSPTPWFDPNPITAQPRYYRATLQVRTNLVFIPPGVFRMGSPSNEVGRVAHEGPQTQVILTQGFFMGRYKVTQADYAWVTGRSPSFFTGNQDRPVESVNWDDATNYCGLLTLRERAGNRIPQDWVYRLPTEAEWEYACRAMTSNCFSYGDDPGYGNLADYAWFADNSGQTTHPVGAKKPNPWGLYDMHGGLWEWVQDWYAPSYPGGQVIDPQGPAAGTYRVFRGGSWGCEPEECRSASRDFNPEGETGYVGFRVVLAPILR